MQRKKSADGQRAREREVVRTQLRDFPSASVAHRASYCMDVLHVTSSSAPFDWLFDAFGPIVWLGRRGFNRSGGGKRLQTYKKVFGKLKRALPWKPNPASVSVVWICQHRYGSCALARSVRSGEEGERGRAEPGNRLAFVGRDVPTFRGCLLPPLTHSALTCFISYHIYCKI